MGAREKGELEIIEMMDSMKVWVETWFYAGALTT